MAGGDLLQRGLEPGVRLHAIELASSETWNTGCTPSCPASRPRRRWRRPSAMRSSAGSGCVRIWSTGSWSWTTMPPSAQYAPLPATGRPGGIRVRGGIEQSASIVLGVLRGYRHADGRIRWVLLVARECVDGDAWRGVVSRLPGAALVAEASGEAVGMLAPIAEPDPMLGRYRGGRGGVGRARPRWCCRGTTAFGAGCARSARCESSFATRASRRRSSSGRRSSAGHGFAGTLTRSRTVARGTSRGIRACTSASSGRSRSGARSRSAPASGTGSVSSFRWEKNSSSLVEVTLKEIEAAGVRREGDGIHSGLRARVWS